MVWNLVKSIVVLTWRAWNRTWQFAQIYPLFSSVPDWQWILFNCCDTRYSSRIMKVEAKYSCETLTPAARRSVNVQWRKQTVISLMIDRQLLISVYAGKTTAVEAIYFSDRLAPIYQKRRCPNTVRCPNCGTNQWLTSVGFTGSLVLYVTKRRLCNRATRRRV